VWRHTEVDNPCVLLPRLGIAGQPALKLHDSFSVRFLINLPFKQEQSANQQGENRQDQTAFDLGPWWQGFIFG
jgi:hypothetical protein